MTGAFRVYQDQVDPADIHFEIAGTAVPADQAQLRDDVAAALIVIRSIFDANDRKFKEYFRQLLSLAQAGLVGETANPEVAARALKGFKEDVTAREAGRIKNQYLRTLGAWAALLAGVFVAAVAILAYWRPATTVAMSFASLEAGAMAGVWLSFGTRRTVLKFEDLNLLEEDRLDPVLRLVFAGLLTFVLGLAFKLRVVSVTLGAVNTERIAGDPTVALFMGLLCGISEKALSTNVVKQASALLK